jgi:uncharacterized protein (DUF1778 family)
MLYKRYHDMSAKKPKRRGAERKTKGILIRVTEAQKRELAATAKKTGLGLSSWMLTVALIAAQEARWREERHAKMKHA